MKKLSLFHGMICLLLCLSACIKKPTEDTEAVVLGQLAVDLDANQSFIRTQEAPIGNFVADAVKDALEGYNQPVDIVLINAGSIRFDAKIRPNGMYKKGNFTTLMLDEMLPFSENKIAILSLTGLQLKEMLERSFAQLPLDKGSFMQVSKGLKIQADLSKPPQILDETVSPPTIQTAGQRLISVQLNETPINDAQLYKVVVADYIAEGNDGYVTCQNLDPSAKIITNYGLTNLVREQVILKSPIQPAIEGRILY